MIPGKLLAIAGTTILALNMTPARAEQSRPSEAAARCEALQKADFSGVPDAPTQLTGTKLVKPEGDAASYCQVLGYVSPQVGFEIRLPAEDWNGKFLEVGCGGTCGKLFTEMGVCDAPVKKGYACAVSDMGHKGSVDALWAYNNLQAEIDFGYRAAHVLAVTGKAIAGRYYEKAPHKSYFMGCSQGGRQAMVEAQRFPWDFDGIIAGAPALNYTAHTLNSLWIVLAAQGQGNEPALPASAVKLLHEAVTARCDLDDGLKDGIIGNPPACKLDPSELVCKAGKSAGCLTQAQADAARKAYSGLKISGGESLYGGASVGSELNWLTTLADPKSIYRSARNDQIHYLSFMPDPGPDWNDAKIDFERDYQRFGMMESLYSASNPDLRRFKAAGGKLIVYHGWNDEAVLPAKTVDYYETVQRTLGGRKATEDFFRLFMLPGVNHCAGGIGADAVDFLGYLEDWVERGQAPDKILAAHPKEAATLSSYPYRPFPSDPSTVSFTRPVYPYPQRAKYQGSGDPNNAAHFQPVER